MFVDGCFWHGCPRHFKAPKTRNRFWTEKIRRNQAKRAQVLAAYGPGWRVFQVFECQIREDIDGISGEMAEVISK